MSRAAYSRIGLRRPAAAGGADTAARVGGLGGFRGGAGGGRTRRAGMEMRGAACRAAATVRPVAAGATRTGAAATLRCTAGTPAVRSAAATPGAPGAGAAARSAASTADLPSLAVRRRGSRALTHDRAGHLRFS
ncbi:hypothetical protein [Phytohabitans rumicis]|uniref:Uncharacterized protein n=1 Tax=Phytohabitans rumicis TaxID=1076125 RepID=A0A6V8LMF6_9ACTN|nr:hypothetical protein [Phytohabitans rumicis]GFJ95356.1 hypothetical protein Prum_089980 [Phytohabitans rumicis]